MNQLYIYIYPHISSLLHLPHPPTFSICKIKAYLDFTPWNKYMEMYLCFSKTSQRCQGWEPPLYTIYGSVFQNGRARLLALGIQEYLLKMQILGPLPCFYIGSLGVWLRNYSLTGFSRDSYGASLVAQCLRICLPMQGTRFRDLVWEDPTCRGATRPVSHNYWACVSGACALQQERPR